VTLPSGARYRMAEEATNLAESIGQIGIAGSDAKDAITILGRMRIKILQLQSRTFWGIEKVLGQKIQHPRVMEARYNAKAVFGPVLDAIREATKDWRQLPMPVRRWRLQDLARLVHRIGVMHKITVN
jgi:hypothetical protein